MLLQPNCGAGLCCPIVEYSDTSTLGTDQDHTLVNGGQPLEQNKKFSHILKHKGPAGIPNGTLDSRQEPSA